MPTEVNLPGAVISGRGDVMNKFKNAAEQATHVLQTKEQLSKSAVNVHRFLSLTLLLSYLDGNPISFQHNGEVSIDWSQNKKLKTLETKRAVARFLGVPSGSTVAEVQFALNYAVAAGTTNLDIALRREQNDDSQRQASSDSVLNLLQAQRAWKRKSMIHKIGAAHIARKIEGKLGVGDVGLNNNEQATVVANVEQSFSNMRVNSDLEDGLRACIDSSDDDVLLVQELCDLLENHVRTVYELYTWFRTASQFTGKLSEDQALLMNDLYLKKTARVIEPLKTTPEEHLAEHENSKKKLHL